jgi:sortase A
MTMPKSRHVSSSTLIAVAFVAAAGVIAWFGMHPSNGGTSQPGQEVSVSGEGRPKPALARAALIDKGGLPTRIVVPAAGVDAAIEEVGLSVTNGKASWETAWRAAGHHIDSAMPGQLGNMVITGHVSVADHNNLAVFRRLENVTAGDTLQVYSGGQAFTYVVSKVMVVPPSAVNVLKSDSTATVTLITCTHDLKNRLVVVGTLAAAA